MLEDSTAVDCQNEDAGVPIDGDDSQDGAGLDMTVQHCNTPEVPETPVGVTPPSEPLCDGLSPCEPVDLTPSASSQDDDHEAIKVIVEDGKLPPIYQQKQCIPIARKEMVTAIVNEDYDRAEKLKSAIKRMTKNSETLEVNTSRNLYNSSLDCQKEDISEREKEVEKEWDEKFSVFNKEEKQQIDDIEARHREERERFEETWSDPEHLIKFNKASQQLLVLRRVQRKLALIHEFEEAKQVKKEADALEAKETEEAKKRAEESMKIAYSQMIARQKREMKCTQDHIARIKNYLKTEKDREMLPYRMSMRAVENKQMASAPTNKKPNPKPRAVVVRSSYGFRTRDLPTPISPHSIRTFNDYKKTPEITHLKLSAINVKKVLGTIRMSSTV